MTDHVRHRLAGSVALGLILVLALTLRLYGLSWDEGLLFHPDERQILMVVDRLSFPWPPDWSLLLTPQSPLNPRFFAYGSLPIYLLRLCASLAGRVWPEAATLESSYVVGRLLSALFDLGTVCLVYRLGRKLYGHRVGLLAAALVALTVLHLQLAHFYTVDTLLAFFVVLTISLGVDLVRRPRIGRGLLVGVSAGMALATKVSAAPLLMSLALAWFFGTLALRREGKRGGLGLWGWAALGWCLTNLAALVTFALLEPYAFIDPVSFLVDLIQESYMARGLADIPYTRQFIGTQPYLYPIWQAIVWSMGIPLGIAGFGGVVPALAAAVSETARRRWIRAGELWLPLSWALVYFGLTGSLRAKFLRYMLPVIPFLCLWAVWALWALLGKRGVPGRWRRRVGRAAMVVVLVGTALYAASYLNVYTQVHPWIQATTWLCENLPRPSQIAVEHWDDPLPLVQGRGDLRCYREHYIRELPMYDPDSESKLESLLGAIQDCDYIILSSNRLYNTIPRLPDRYPLSSRYYRLLLGEQLGYELVYYKAVYPSLFGVDLVNDTFSDPDLPRPGLLAQEEAMRCRINLGRADESYSVYDHPKPLVFKKTHQLSRDALLELFGDAAQGLPES